ncbi:response regulator [Paenibacillus flagellatus]|uniref:DNA-binding response regulator n=1 Tax=Paenibacillus flagellatus TaxID=2211139 RepID=A0A2V5K3X6_9BACL|nr:response regulator [Paenibacillus flagellatus]PYI53985.1 hypothetical protein DLM86_15665 [Paenibacillus flagellatus]
MDVKLLLADDEPIIREGIRNKLDWDALGIELVGAAEDGKAALELLKSEPVDILLTDIHMPRMDGIQLGREARKLYPNIKIVILSGHEDFEFAKQALELSAMKYMLKPFTRSELEQAVLQAKREVAGYRQAESSLRLTMKRLQESYPLLRENVLTSLVEGRLNERGARQKLESLEIDLTGDRFAVWIVEPEPPAGRRTGAEHKPLSAGAADRGGDAEEPPLLRLRDGIEAYLRDRKRAAVSFGSGAGVICILEGDGPEDRDRLPDLAEGVKAHVRETMNVPVTIGMGGVKCGLEGIAESYREATEALAYRFWTCGSSVISAGSIRSLTEPGRFAVPEKHIEKLTAAALQGDEAGIRGELEAIFAFIRSRTGVSITEIKIGMKEFLAHALRRLPDSGARLAERYGKEYDPYSAVDRYRTMDEMEQQLHGLFLDLSDFVRDKRGGRTRTVIRKAIELIEAHYRVEDLSINRLAEELHMNASYFSRLFSQETGYTFTEYLTMTRLEKAKLLLRDTSLRVSEIAFEIGLRDPFYFSTLFKRYTGLKPTEYRER